MDKLLLLRNTSMTLNDLFSKKELSYFIATNIFVEKNMVTIDVRRIIIIVLSNGACCTKTVTFLWHFLKSKY